MTLNISNHASFIPPPTYEEALRLPTYLASATSIETTSTIASNIAVLDMPFVQSRRCGNSDKVARYAILAFSLVGFTMAIISLMTAVVGSNSNDDTIVSNSLNAAIAGGTLYGLAVSQTIILLTLKRVKYYSPQEADWGSWKYVSDSELIKYTLMPTFLIYWIPSIRRSNV
jgi:hypothetical protein